MNLFKDLKAVIIAFIVIIALSSFLIFPLLAQDSGDSDPDEDSEIPTEQIDEAEEGTTTSPIDALTAVDATSSSETSIRAPVNFQKPSGFELKDFPNDVGGSFLITWPLTDNEKNDPDSISGYTYRIYHSADQTDVVGGNIKHIDANEEAGTSASYIDFEPFTDTLATIRTKFWPKKINAHTHAYQWDVPAIPVLGSDGEPKTDPKDKVITKVDLGNTHYFQLAVVSNNGGPVEMIGPAQSAIGKTNFFNGLKINNMLICVIYTLIVLWFISHAKKGKELFIRKIAGLDAVEEAIGRATEMGRPILYVCGLESMASLATIAAVNILGQVAKKVADYDSKIINPHRDPIVMSVAQETVKNAYLDAGRPDAFDPDSIFFLTDDQFSFVAAIDGIMVREKPATNIFMGYYYAESLILAETGASTGAIQIAGTDAIVQLPFFITTCDYTLIGEELYAASAYLAREPLLLGSLKGQDVGKMFMIVMLFLGIFLLTINSNIDFIKNLFAPA